MGRLRTRCEVGLAGKHSAERWRRCWGGTAGRSLDQTRTSIHDLLKVTPLPSFCCPQPGRVADFRAVHRSSAQA